MNESRFEEMAKAWARKYCASMSEHEIRILAIGMCVGYQVSQNESARAEKGAGNE